MVLLSLKINNMTAAALDGTLGDDDIAGTENDDFFFLDDGGNDHVVGGAGDDSFYFGAALAAGDSIDGGSGAGDMLILQGQYLMGLGDVGLAGVETIVLMTAADTRFGASGSGANSYNLTADDANIAAGGQLAIQGSRLGAAEALTFNGLAETDGSFRLIGGAANDFLIGGWGADVLVGGLGSDLMNGAGGMTCSSIAASPNRFRRRPTASRGSRRAT